MQRPEGRFFREVAVYDGGRRQYRRIDLPNIVCLCGSTKFHQEFQRANYEETMAGNIVLTVGFFMHSAEAAHGEEWACTPEQKVGLDQLHLRKIDLCDEIFVINVDGYVGESTMSEMAYAILRRKGIRWLEEPPGGEEEWLFTRRHAFGKLIAKHAGMLTEDNEEKTITLDQGIEGVGEAGDQVTLRNLMTWAGMQSLPIQGTQRTEQGWDDD
jgi:hypothetical protein